jgi:hypothetical protein
LAVTVNQTGGAVAAVTDPLISEVIPNSGQAVEEEERKIEEDSSSIFDFAVPILSMILETLNKDLYANSRVLKSTLASIRNSLQEIVLVDRRDNNEMFREEVMALIHRLVTLQSNETNSSEKSSAQVRDEMNESFEKNFQRFKQDVLSSSPVNKAYAMRQLISLMQKRDYVSHSISSLFIRT